VSDAAVLLREARLRAGLSQSQLARRLGLSQASVAKLERQGSNPTLNTLDAALAATGHRLRLDAPAQFSGVDETLIRQHLQLPVAERIRGIEIMYDQARALALAGAGELR